MGSRLAAVHPDILEFFLANKTVLRTFRKEWRALEKGFVGYCKDFTDTLKELRGKDRAEKDELERNEPAMASRAVNQYCESEELAKRMKWKRITWDDEADYNGFARRLLDNDDLIKNVPAFSFLSIHITKDLSCTAFASLPVREQHIEQGTLTNWFLNERIPTVVNKYVPSKARCVQSPFVVDWTAGEAKVADTTSIQEVLVFLRTVAPRLQALQVRMEEQQCQITKDLARLKLCVAADIKYNKYDTSTWDDPDRGTDTDYVNPDDVQQFIKSMLKSALLYRWFLKGQRIRIVPPGRPYLLSLEKKEVQIPSDFATHNWRGAHVRFEAVEVLVTFLTNIWWFWFTLAIIIVGDIEIF